MGEFFVFPAIDLYQGQTVRLQQGDPRRLTVYRETAEGYARRWLADGARWLHVVNLDGAFTAKEDENERTLRSIVSLAQQCRAMVQFGGGMRTLSAIEAALSMGVERVMLGTLAVEEPDTVHTAIRRFSPARIVVAVDVENGWVKTHGWQKDSRLSYLQVVRSLAEKGVRYFLLTDIQRDGMKQGLNLELAGELISMPEVKVILAGGVKSLKDVRAAKGLGAAGVVLGRALYDGKVNLREALLYEEDAEC
ncbi:MAG: 1-(5-phosphoribosyl)-5-[(5-phosphoribosylamino)methylideneamino]imidazole-4-carboxamide isomerase [Chloroflexota bacterium]